METALKIHVTGIVQGVGFRPFVYKQAKLFLIKGWVLNADDGVHIHAEGDEKLVDEFCMSLANDAPASAKVDQIEMREVPLQNFNTFEIKTSIDSKKSENKTLVQTLISADLATCKDCQKELFDKTDRRYRYPFINCTNCGPRFTIIDSLPYDRKTTSMNKFKMCEKCSSEFEDIEDRRFHAQPNACFECGPYITWEELGDNQQSENNEKIIGDTQEKSNEIFKRCVDFLKKGKIVAIKGLGGFHLACDASNADAVANLRNRKMRSNKAFAIMAKDVECLKNICELNKVEEELLCGSVRPIVLLKRKSQNEIAENVFNGLPEIGVMLPYTPVQHILLNDFCNAGGKFLVMTSGNLYDNPIIIDDGVARSSFLKIADAILSNNRKIVERYDDSVVRVIDAGGQDAIQMIRRTRGYSPVPIKVKLDNNAIEKFATGAEQKNTFAFSRPLKDAKDSVKFNAEVFVSQHIGDLENAEVFETWKNTKNIYEHMFCLSPDQISCDMHPEYLNTKWANAQKSKNPVNYIQHHFAHIRSVMYENQLTGPVCGFAFDGTGYGVDNQIWGGECLLCNTQDFERFANFVYVPMPGGAACIKDPTKMAYSCLWAYDLLDLEATQTFVKKINTNEAANLKQMIEQGINCPTTSSVGRLFDAAAAILGICENTTYEGEPAIMLEAKLWEYLNSSNRTNVPFDNRYEIQITKNIGSKNSTAQDTSVLLMDPANTFKALLEDLAADIEIGLICKHFHDAFVRAIVVVAQLCNQVYGIKQVALSGGVFMNRYLIESSIKLLVDSGFSVAINRELPPNDGSISLGQL